jgi:predicted membrane-bound spermidine synthase
MKKIISYFFPFRQKKYDSKISGVLEINLVDGKKVLDTANSNYSYGSLQKILHRGLEEINFDDSFQKVLVLGMGGGSIVETIREDFRSNAFIELVDIDEAIISIAKTEFELERYGKINLVLKDANDYIYATKETFDLIIVDVFIGDTVPEKITENKFTGQLALHLNSTGKLIYNTMRSTMKRDIVKQIIDGLEQSGLTVKVIEKIQTTNDLIVAEKNKI